MQIRLYYNQICFTLFSLSNIYCRIFYCLFVVIRLSHSFSCDSEVPIRLIFCKQSQCSLRCKLLRKNKRRKKNVCSSRLLLIRKKNLIQVSTILFTFYCEEEMQKMRTNLLNNSSVHSYSRIRSG